MSRPNFAEDLSPNPIRVSVQYEDGMDIVVGVPEGSESARLYEILNGYNSLLQWLDARQSFTSEQIRSILRNGECSDLPQKCVHEA